MKNRPASFIPGQAEGWREGWWGKVVWVLGRVLVISVPLLLILILLLQGRAPTLEEWQILVQMGALIVAGLWTYFLFVRSRKDYPRTAVKHEMTHLRVDEDRLLLRLGIELRNISDVLVPLRFAEIHVHQVHPLPATVKQQLYNGSEEEIREGKSGAFARGVIQWPEIGYRRIEWEQGEVEVEPAEAEHFYFDFLLDPQIRAVEVVSTFKNPRRGTAFGWVKKTIYNLEEE